MVELENYDCKIFSDTLEEEAIEQVQRSVRDYPDSVREVSGYIRRTCYRCGRTKDFPIFEGMYNNHFVKVPFYGENDETWYWIQPDGGEFRYLFCPDCYFDYITEDE